MNYKYHVEAFFCDTKNIMSIPMLGRQLLNTAERDAMNNNILRRDSNKVWVIARLNIELDALPRIAEDYEMITWISKNYKGAFSERDFRLVDCEGKEFGRAKTIWSMIDYISREPINLHQEFPHLDELIVNNDIAISTLPKVRFTDEFETISRHVLYCDLDKNCHLNSIAYIKFVIDTFSLDFHSQFRVHKMEVAFQHECYFDSTLTIKKCTISKTDYLFAIYDGEICACKIRMTFTSI